MKSNKKIKAFSLIELSVVITIVALIAVAFLSFSTSYDVLKKYEITQKRMEAIYKAMGIYLAKNGKLLCPAPMNTVTRTDSTYGTAVSTCSSAPGSALGYWTTTASDDNIYMGMVPVKDLGLPSEFAEDGFGTRFDYIVLTGFTNTADFGSSANGTYINDTTAVSPQLRLAVHKKVGSGDHVEITHDAMFVIISHGANKYGGWNSNSTTQNSTPTLTQETYNAASSIDTPTAGKAVFFSYTISGTTNAFLGSYNDSGFDDVLFYKSRNEMVKDFSLYWLLPCSSNATNESITYGGTPADYSWSGSSSIRYGETVMSTTQCPVSYRNGVYSPTKKCGAYGAWEAYHVHDCT